MSIPFDLDNPIFWATCAPSTEKALKFELEKLGGKILERRRGALKFTGPLSLVAEANVFSRIAQKILWQLKTFEASSTDELQEQLITFPFEKILDVKTSFACSSHLYQAPLNHSHYAALPESVLLSPHDQDGSEDHEERDGFTSARRETNFQIGEISENPACDCVMVIKIVVIIA